MRLCEISGSLAIFVRLMGSMSGVAMGNRCFAICAFFVVLQGCSGSPAEEFLFSDWVLVGGAQEVAGTGKVKVYIDKNSLEKIGDVVAYKEKFIVSDDVDGVVEIRSNSEMECEKKLRKTKTIDTYFNNGEVTYSTEYGGWEDIKLDFSSNSFFMYEFVCLKN
jgi:hypothetical protein